MNIYTILVTQGNRGGGTALGDAFLKVFELVPDMRNGSKKALFILTDGVVTIGDDPSALAQSLRWIYLKGRYTIGNCQRPVFSLGVSQHMHKITNLWTFELNWSSKLRENDERKNTLVGRICVLSDRNKRLLARSRLLFQWEITSFSKLLLLQREPFLTMFYTINSSPMLVTKSVFKLILFWVITKRVPSL